MPKSTNTCNSILGLIFLGTAWADIAENDGSAPLANLYLALYTDTPGVGDDPQTNEVQVAAYASYARKAVARSAAGWDTLTAGHIQNAALLQFVECSGGTGAHISHVAIVTTASGAGTVLYAGELTAHRDVSAGIQPQFGIGALIITET
jgi:hypothetical protein